MAGDLSAHRRHRALQTFGDFTQRRSASDRARDVLSLRQCECSQRAQAGDRSDRAMTRQQEVNDHMTFAEGARDLV